MKYSIRKACPEDARGIARVHVQSWRETYQGIVDHVYLDSLDVIHRTRRWKEMLKKPKEQSWTFVAEDSDGKIVGFTSGGAARERMSDYTGEMYAIYILKEGQGSKLGYRLTQKLCSVLRKNGINNMYVCVLKDNNSLGFYKRYGARYLKSTRLKVGERELPERYYGWRNFDLFI
jgi:L-amino acid N-acyltransferase YncA